MALKNAFRTYNFIKERIPNSENLKAFFGGIQNFIGDDTDNFKFVQHLHELLGYASGELTSRVHKLPLKYSKIDDDTLDLMLQSLYSIASRTEKSYNDTVLRLAYACDILSLSNQFQANHEKNTLPEQIKFLNEMHNNSKHASFCYSQEGEELILSRLITKKNGFYVDVGAYHPKRFSNTYFFYKKGWNGINIDASEENIEAFKSERPNDTNLNYIINNKGKDSETLYLYKEEAYNTTCPDRVEHLKNTLNMSPLKEKNVPSTGLGSILENNNVQKDQIDILNIDVEGVELEVLNSIDLEKHRPHYILIEIFSPSVSELLEKESYKFLVAANYKLISKLFNTAIFARNDALTD